MANKTITLSPEQYDKLIELVHEERDCVGAQIADDDILFMGDEKEELEADTILKQHEDELDEEIKMWERKLASHKQNNLSIITLSSLKEIPHGISRSESPVPRLTQ